jgi:hypothetical protein
MKLRRDELSKHHVAESLYPYRVEPNIRDTLQALSFTPAPQTLACWEMYRREDSFVAVHRRRGTATPNFVIAGPTQQGNYFLENIAELTPLLEQHARPEHVVTNSTASAFAYGVAGAALFITALHVAYAKLVHHEPALTPEAVTLTIGVALGYALDAFRWLYHEAQADLIPDQAQTYAYGPTAERRLEEMLHPQPQPAYEREIVLSASSPQNA